MIKKVPPSGDHQILKKKDKVKGNQKWTIQIEKLLEANASLKEQLKKLTKSADISTEKILEKNTYHLLSDTEKDNEVEMREMIPEVDTEVNSDIDPFLLQIKEKNKNTKVSRKSVVKINSEKDASEKKSKFNTTKNVDSESEKREEANNIDKPKTVINGPDTAAAKKSANAGLLPGNKTKPNSSAEPIIKKGKKMPPINIYNQNVNDIIKAITHKLKIKNFYTQQINKNKQAIHTADIEGYNKIKELLIELEVPYFTYTPKQEKNNTYILKGLNADDNNEEILAELKQHETETLEFLKVKKFTTRKSNTNKVIPFYLVTVSNSCNYKELSQVNRINYQVVHWEKLEKKDITQCYRCQRFGHTATNCNMDFRCVKCGQNHEPGKCSLLESNNEKDSLYCVQCKQHGHPASYRGCPKHVELLNRLKQKQLLSKKNVEEKKAMYNNFVQKNTTFSSMFGSPQATQTHTNTQKQPLLPTPNITPNIQSYTQTDFGSMLAEFQKNLLAIMQANFNKMQGLIDAQGTRIDIVFEMIGVESNVSI